MRKLRLKNTPKENIQILGICSTEKIYKLCWEMNQLFDFQFINVDSHRVEEKGTICSHILYQFVDYEQEIRYYMVQNKTPYSYLSVEHKIVDYFFISISSCENLIFDEIKQNCKAIKSVRLILDIDYHRLKKKDNFYILG